MMDAQNKRLPSKRRKKRHPAKIIIGGFSLIILLGAFLLSLPIAQRTSVSFFDALFTSISAVALTGLVVVDTGSSWSMFGISVILVLIQIGSLGFMSMITLVFLLIRKKIGLSERLLLMQSINLQDLGGGVRLIKRVLFGTLILQGIGTFVLWIQLFPYYGLFRGFGMALFHAISAFGNAGFDLFGYREAFRGIGHLYGNEAILVTMMVLIVVGGLGFFVWEDIYENKFKFKRLRLHSKLVLSTTAILILAGTLLLFLSERSNPSTIAYLPLHKQGLLSLFNAVTPRTAGFSIIDIQNLNGTSRFITMLLMLIGGSPGSTSGGIKNVTIAILLITAYTQFKGKQDVHAFGRSIPTTQIRSALGITVLVILMVLSGSIVIGMLQPELAFNAVLFEVVSAITTTGLTTGITAELNDISRVIIMAFMLLGRIGIMTFAIAIFTKREKREKTKHPEAWIMLG